MTKTLTLTPIQNFLMHFALTKAHIPGTRLDDLDNLFAARKLFACDPFDGERTVEVPSPLVRYVQAAWPLLPVGELPRTDDLPDAVKAVTEKLKD